jgi:hypothetical protein
LNSNSEVGNVKKVKPIDVLTEIKTELGLLTNNGPAKILDNLSIQLKESVTIKSLIEFFKEAPEYSDVILTKIHDVFDIFYDLIKALEIERFFRMKGINQICNNRVIEGQFINDSLFKVRETIKTILKEKNKGKNISPLFVDECFEQYCPNHEYCFTSESEERERIEKEAKESLDEEQVPSVSTILFTDIFGKIHSKLYQGSETSINEMYKNIVVSVFCVFNISPSANNPPPVPYIDINNLKYIYQYLMVGQNYSPELKNTLKTELERIYKLITVDFIDKVNDLVIARILDKNKVGLYGDLKTKLYIVTAIEFLIDNIKTNGSFNIPNTKGLIRQFIELIDNSNAISAIGTLEFLDQLAKFNTVTNVCRLDTNYIGQAAAYDENKMTELYV